MDARAAAFQALYLSQKKGADSAGALKRTLEEAQLSERDVSLARELCLGVLRNQMLLDFYLAAFSHRSLSRMETSVLLCLRLGAYQLLFLQRIPHSAAVNESVRLCRRHSRSPAAPAFVNALLRSFARSLPDLPELPLDEPVHALSVRYSHPRWFTERCLEDFGADLAQRVLSADNQTPPIYLQVNTLKTTGQALSRALSGQAEQVTPHPWLDDCLLLSGTGRLERLRAFQDGWFFVQDPASRLAILACQSEPGMRVLDMCAAPGGKSFSCAIGMGGRGEILSCDVQAAKLRLISEGAERLGLSIIRPCQADGRICRPEWLGRFDRVLVDAPCSGFGVIRKKPDVRYKRPEEISQLPRLQLELLRNASRYVKPGGILLYSTCTILREENQDVVSAFLLQCPDYMPEPFSLPGPLGCAEGGMLTLLPGLYDTDGFFIARLRRRADAV